MRNESEILGLLERVDWDFYGSSTLLSSVHSLHWYPGNILPQIPNYLINLLSSKGDLVFDPFCGSGTIGIEAILLGRHTWQSDICKAGILVARGKLGACFGQKISVALEKIYNSFLYESNCYSEKNGQNGEGSDIELKYWLGENTHGQLRYIWSIIESQEIESVRDVLKLIFTDTLFACSSTSSSKTSSGKVRRHHWGWVADNVRPKKPINHNAIGIFKQKLTVAIRIIRSLKINDEIKMDSQRDLNALLVEDARHSSISSNSVDLVVTSPPFLGMTDYTLANRMTYLWMGWAIKDDFEIEIGTRRKRTKKNAEEEYLVDIGKAWQEIYRALKPGCFCAVIIGASRKFPEVIKMFINQVEGSGFRLFWGPKERFPSRRRVSSQSDIKSKEYICVWQKI